MSLYKAQAEISLQDKASGPFQQMAAKMRNAATKMGKGVSGIFTKMRSVITGVFKSITRSITTFLPLLTVGGLAYGFISATKAASVFTDQMAKVSTMLSGQSLNYMNKFTSAIKKMSVEFGRSTEDLSQGLYNILSAGIPAADAIEHLTVVNKAAVGGFAPLGEVARAVSAIMVAYKKDGMTAAKATDILAATVEDGITTMSELAPTIGMVTSMAGQMGISMQDLAGFIAQVTRSGVGTSMSLTSVRAVLNQMANPAEEAAGAMKVFKDALATGGIKEFARVLTEAGYSAEELSRLFPNIRAKIALGQVIGNVDALSASIDKAANSAGMSQRKFEQMIATPAFRLAQMRQELVAVKRTVGEALLPGLLEALSVVSKLLKTDWIQKALKSIGQTLGSVISNVFKIIGLIGMGIEKYGSFLDFVSQSTDATWDYLNSKIIELSVIALQVLKVTISTAISMSVAATSMGMRLIGAAIKAFLPTGFGWIGDVFTAGGRAIADGAGFIIKEINGIIDNSVNFWADKAKTLKDNALGSGEDFIKELEGVASSAIDKTGKKVDGWFDVLGKQFIHATRPAWHETFGRPGMGTTPVDTKRFGPEYGKQPPTPPSSRKRRKVIRDAYEMMMGQLTTAQALGGFGLKYGGLEAGRAARFIRQFGPEEGMKKFSEKMAREQRLAPGVGFFRDITPAARQRMRQQAVQQAMMQQRPEEFAGRITGRIGQLRGQLTEAIMGGKQGRITAIQGQIDKLQEARAGITPGLKSQLDHLKKVRDAMKDAGKKIPEKLGKKITGLQKAIGEEAEETKADEEKQKEKDADMLKQKAETAVKNAAPAIKNYIKSGIVDPLIDAMKKNKAEATAIAIAEGNRVEEHTNVTPRQDKVPTTFWEPHSQATQGAPVV